MLTLSNRHDREEYTKKQLNAFLADEYPGFIADQLRMQYATPFPFNALIMDAFNRSGKGRFTKPNEFDCSRNHYSIVRQALDDPNCKSLLVFEDDIRFLKDVDVWNDYIDHIPEDYDIIQFGAFSADPNINKYIRPNTTEYWVKHPDVGMWTTAMYALSRKGMKYYLAMMDKLFWVADGPLYKANINSKVVNAYIATTPLIIQANKDIISSDIRDSENDTTDYENQNRYEGNINKDDYFDFEFPEKNPR